MASDKNSPTNDQIMRKINLNRADLAVNGGPPIRIKPWFDNFTIGEEEKAAVLRVIDSGYLSLFEGSHTPDHPFSFNGGPEVQALEEEWCDYYGSMHAISVNSATSGIYAAIGALELGFGDEVIVSPYTMSACAMAPMIYGAIPVFADIEPETGCISPKSIAKCINEKTKGILVVHQFGFPADMDQIMALAHQHDLRVIEDCAQCHGAKYKGRNLGTIGDIGVFSLNVNKTIQSGEGGVCVTNDANFAYRLQLIRNHGEAVVGVAGYENIINIAGFNYRMTELSAAIARVQLKKLPSLNSKRLELVEQLKDALKPYEFFQPLQGRLECQTCSCSPTTKCLSTYYIFPIRYFSEHTGVDRDTFVKVLNSEGALFYQGYTPPLYLQPVYQRKILFKNGYPFSAKENQKCVQNYEKGICPTAEKLHFEQMVVSEHVRMPHTESDIKDIVKCIEKIM
jgi:perosamine synthetase